MPSDQGNAVDAKWVGPSGYQLWDGTQLNPGDIVLSIGKDEAEASPYWHIVKVSKNDEPVSDASPGRVDWSFGEEEGGGATGRPERPEDSKPELPVQSVSTSSGDKGADA